VTTFEHILVPLDLSAQNQRALSTALQLARANGARVTLLHVIQRIADLPPADVRGFYEQVRKVAHARLTRAARPFAARKIDVRSAVFVGTPAEEIVRYAAANRVDLIVLASHKINLSRSARGWGTTSYKVGILCQCPVLLVK
jgi:nucleotide-binding universal stress UspA family protein